MNPSRVHHSLRLSHSPHPHRLPDTLKRLLASVLEPHAPPTCAQRAHRLRHEHFSGRRQPADARGDVNRTAVDVVVLADDVPCVEADVEGKARIVAGAAAGEGGLDRLTGGTEDGENTIPEELAFDSHAGVFVDNGAESAIEIAGLLAEGGVAEALGERRG